MGITEVLLEVCTRRFQVSHPTLDADWLSGNDFNAQLFNSEAVFLRTLTEIIFASWSPDQIRKFEMHRPNFDSGK